MGRKSGLEGSDAMLIVECQRVPFKGRDTGRKVYVKASDGFDGFEDLVATLTLVESALPRWSIDAW